MNIKYIKNTLISVSIICASFTIMNTANAKVSHINVSPEIIIIQQEWGRLNFLKEFKNKNYKALQSLAKKANKLSMKYPNSAEALAWDAIVLSTLAEKKGGIGALSLVNEAKRKLEAAEKINPTALDGSIYASLGTLYSKVPGWPIAFGSDSKAEQYFLKALKVNPNTLDTNYFYADFLADNNQTKLAIKHLDIAIQSPQLIDRPLADQGRRAQAKALRYYLINLIPDDSSFDDYF